MLPARFAANLDWLYPELSYLDRIDAARADGFARVELLFAHLQERAGLLARLDREPAAGNLDRLGAEVAAGRADPVAAAAEMLRLLE